MAINLNTTLPFGTVANYYRINQITIDRTRCRIVVSLNLYVTQALRQSNSTPASSVQVNLSNFYAALVEAPLTNNIVGQCYQYIMSLPQFAGSTEV